MQESLNWYEVPLQKWRFDRDSPLTVKEPDWQRQRVYKAETVLDNAPQKRFNSIEECDDYVQHLVSLDYYTRRFGQFPIKVEARKYGAAMGAYRGTRGKIWLPSWAWKEVTILHEISHAVNPPDAGGGHGRRFCRIYLDLIGFKLGRDWEDILRKSFQQHGVKSNPKRPPSVLSEECIAKRVSRYTKQIPDRVMSANTFPDTCAQVTDWIAQQQGWKPEDLELRRFVPGYFKFVKFPNANGQHLRVDVYTLADLTCNEWMIVLLDGMRQIGE